MTHISWISMFTQHWLLTYKKNSAFCMCVGPNGSKCITHYTHKPFQRKMRKTAAPTSQHFALFSTKKALAISAQSCIAFHALPANFSHSARTHNHSAESEKISKKFPHSLLHINAQNQGSSAVQK